MTLTSGYKVIFTEGEFAGFIAPDDFFTDGEEIDLKSFIGKATISQNEAEKRVRMFVDSLGVETERSWWAKEPEVIRPRVKPPTEVPRLLLEWRDDTGGILRHWVRAEIDTKTGLLKQLLVRPVGP